ncbi:MAG: CoA transferase [Burkholderiaceae bacterium]
MRQAQDKAGGSPVQDEALHPDPGALSGLLVLDLGQAAVGPVAATYLGMMGATVLKVEQPAGDSVRRGQPTMRGTSTTFVGNNLTKRDVVLDMKSPQGRDDAKRLIAKADILIENFRSPAVMQRLGLGYAEVLAPLNPGLIYLQSSAFGPAGPWSGMFSNEWMTEAVSGCVSCTGGAGGVGEFTRGSALLDWNGAMLNTVACLAALMQRERTGRGQMLQASQFGSSVFCGLTRIAEFLAGRGEPGSAPLPLGSASACMVPEQAFRARDGFVNVAAPGEKFWRRLCEVLKRPALADDPRFRDNAARVHHRLALVAELAPVFAERTVHEWLTALRAADVPCGANPREETLTGPQLRDPQIVANGMLTRIDSSYGSVLTQAPHWRFEKTPAGIARPSPGFDEHTKAVLQSIANWVPFHGRTRRAQSQPQSQSQSQSQSQTAANADAPATATGGALAGLRVVEFAFGIPGPLAGMVLRQLGATVTRVVPPTGDWLRELGEGAVHTLLNAGKQTLVADLKTESGRLAIQPLLASADLVLVGHRAHKLQALGLSGEQIRAVNPAAVHCHVGGWGSQGPHSTTGATELLVQAAVGVPRYLGQADDEPVRLGFDVVSVATAFAAVQASLAALLWRRESGEGQQVEVNMLAAALAVNQWATVADSGVDRPAGRQLKGQDWPRDHGFACREGRCLIDFRERSKWFSLAAGVGRADLLRDERFIAAMDTHPGLVAPFLDQDLGKWSLRAIERLVRDELGGTVVPVLDIPSLLAHAQSQVVDVVRQTGGGLVVRLPISSSDGLLSEAFA